VAAAHVAGERRALGSGAVTTAETRSYPGARPPDRQRRVDTSGVALAVHEWGDEGAPPVLLAHGGFDFGRTYDVFAPLLAEAGWRVVAWDQRGHGDSEHAALYQWDADIRDALAVFDSVTPEPLPVIGHSKGGSLMSQLAASMPGRISSLVNIDGVPSKRTMPDVQDHDRTKLLADELASWLDFRRRAATNTRKPGTIEELARRRSAMNPRLPAEWLEYLVTVGARRDEDGWRWKIDPSLRMGGFGPWRPEWALHRMPDISVPFLVVLGSEQEPMGWGTVLEDVPPYLPAQARLHQATGVGHFVHIEAPAWTAELVLDHLGRPGVR